MRQRSAAELWEWLRACRDCGQVHEYREVGFKQWSWAAEDGHAYRTRVMGGADVLMQLQAQWERAQS